MSETLRDAKISQILKRHFVSVALDVDNAPPEARAIFQQIGGNTLPYVAVLSDRGLYINGSSGGASVLELKSDLEKALEHKAVATPKTREPELNKQLEALQKALDDKKPKEAMNVLAAINRIRGYHALKDKVHDALDKAQEDGLKKLTEAYEAARRNEYAGAKTALEGIPKDFAGLPVAEEANQHLGAVKMLEAIHKITSDKKGAWKQAAVQRLGQLLAKYGDTPYANLAVQQQEELTKGSNPN